MTARRREERLIDAPVAVSVYGAGILKDADITSPQELFALTPGGSARSDGGGNTIFSLRGVTNGPVDLGEPGVAIYTDGVYSGGLRTNVPEQYDLQRVEVLRGPQTALYGRNAVGGAVSFISAPADAARTAGSLEAQYGRYDRWDVRGVANLAIDDNTAVRFAGWAERQSGGAFYSPFNDRHLDADHNYGGRLSLLKKAGSFEFRLVAEYDDRRAGDPLIFPPETPQTASRNLITRIDTRTFRITPQLVAQTPLGALTLIYGYRKYSSDELSDSDYGAASIPNVPSTAFGVSRERGDYHYAEARLASNGSGPLRYLVGVNYFNEDYRQGDPGTGFFITDTGSPLAGCRFLPTLTLPFSCNSTLGTINNQQTSAYAGFAELTYALTPQIEISGGVRYTRDRKSIDLVQSSSGLLSLFLRNYTLNQVKTFDRWSPGGSITWRPDAMTTIYGRINTGFRDGGFNSAQLPNAQLPFDQETSVSYELGAKRSWLGGRLLTSAAVYRLDQNNVLVTIADIATGIPSIRNAGKATTYGGEVEAQVRLRDDLSFSATASRLEPKFTGGTTLISTGVVALDKRAIPGVPEWTASLLGAWTPRITAALRGDVTLAYRYRDALQVLDPALPSGEGFSIADVHAGVRTERWFAQGYVDNIGDDRYGVRYQTSLLRPGQIGVLFDRGRTYGVRVGASF